MSGIPKVWGGLQAATRGGALSMIKHAAFRRKLVIVFFPEVWAIGGVSTQLDTDGGGFVVFIVRLLH